MIPCANEKMFRKEMEAFLREALNSESIFKAHLYLHESPLTVFTAGYLNAYPAALKEMHK